MNDQIRLLNELASKIKVTEATKEQSMATLIAAKILTKNGKLASQYSNLNRLMSK